MTLRAVLKKGSQGASVEELQGKLREAGAKIQVTGAFDEPTLRAVQEFQKSHGLVADGVVGPKTWTAFETRGQTEFLCGTIRVDLSTVLRMCPGAPEENVRQNLPRILKELDSRALANEDMIRMALATVYVETGEFAPISEFKSKYNTSPGGKPFDLYDSRKDLGNHGPPDGERYKGRGFVQLTGRANYERYGRSLGVDLISNPELANAPTIAAAILCEYLRSKEERIGMALEQGDLTRARKLVNGGTHGLDRFVACFNAWEARPRQARPGRRVA